MNFSKPSVSDSHTIALQLLSELQALENPEDKAGQAHFGIAVDKSFGIRVPLLRAMVKPYRRNHELSEALWQLDYRETRLLAAMVGDPKQVTEAQMERWVLEVNSWDVCDTLMGELFEPSALGYHKAHQWAQREEEFVRRSAFSLIAWLAVHRKKDADDPFLDFLPLIEQAADDDRNFVKKAVNWALRQIGKRSAGLHPSAVACANRLADRPEASARWIGKDALRELEGEKVLQRLGLS